MKLKHLNVPIEDDRLNDLKFIQSCYSQDSGVRFSQAQALKKLIFSEANRLRNDKKKEEIQQ